jgi:hypothetical protein
MNALAAIESIPCEVKNVTADLVQVTFTLPACHINDFVMMLSSMTQLFRGLGWKAKTNRDGVLLRHAQREPEIAKRNEEYEKAVCDCFLKNIKRSETPREALSLTVSQIFQDYPFSSYDIVKNCLTRNKMLKKSGFYKARHNYEKNNDDI